MRKTPVIDLSGCTDCESCVELCPALFQRNPETGYIEIQDFEDYSEEEVQEAISVCPADCISWDEQ